MAIAEIIQRQFRWGTQSALGTPASATGGRFLNFRPTSTGGLIKEAFTSDTVQTNQQRANGRHGLRSASFTIDQELQNGAHTGQFANLLRANWVDGPSTGPQTNISMNSGTRTIARAAGSFITDGFRVGDIVRCFGFTNAGNNNKNFRLNSVTATTMVFAPDAWLSLGGAVTTESAGASVTVSAPGRKLQAPSTGHTKNYITLEDWMPDITRSIRADDCLVSGLTLEVGSGANATASWSMVGRTVTQASSAYFTTNAAAPTGQFLSGPSALLSINGNTIAVLQNLSLTVATGAEVRAVVGANVSPDVFRSDIAVSGSFSAMLEDATITGLFDAETEVPIALWLFETSAQNSDVLAIKLPRVKINAATPSVDGPIVNLSAEFTAGPSAGTTSTEATTMVVQDTAVSTSN